MVKFVDDNGVEFFECHPAEARTAIEIIQDIRDRKPPLDPFVKKVLKLVPKVISGPRTRIKSDKGGNVHRIADCFAAIEQHDERVVLLLCNAITYAEVRKFDRDLLDIETTETMLKTGILARMWSAYVIVDRTVPKDLFIVSDESGKYVMEVEATNKTAPLRDALERLRDLVTDIMKMVG